MSSSSHFFGLLAPLARLSRRRVASLRRCRPRRGGGGGAPSLVTVNHASRAATALSLSLPPSSHAAAAAPTSVVPSASSQQPAPPLPLLREVAAADRAGLLLCKLRLVVALFDSLKHPREKEAKRQALLELVDYVQAPFLAANASALASLPENVQEALVAAISVNVFRTLPPALHELAAVIDPGAVPNDEEEPYLDPAWPHLQLVYELLLRYVMIVISPDTDTKGKRKEKGGRE